MFFGGFKISSPNASKVTFFRKTDYTVLAKTQFFEKFVTLHETYSKQATREMDPIKCEFLVVGGGIVGLATAAVLSKMGTTILVEKEKDYLRHTSSRNSGVVHAGIYYPPASLKTRLCMAGNVNMWNLVDNNENKQRRYTSEIIAKKCGKWIGATNPAEEIELQKLAKNMENRSIPFRWVPNAEVKAKEPLLAMSLVLESPSTGIVNVDALASVFRAMLDESAAENGSLATTGLELVRLEEVSSEPNAHRSSTASIDRNTKLLRAVCVPPHRAAPSSSSSSSFSSLISQHEDAVVIEAQRFISSMGNYSNNLWENILVEAQGIVPENLRTYHCKGRYVSIRGKQPLSRLVYPCPLPNLKGLGTHSVVTMEGKVIFGPDAVYVERGEEDRSPPVAASASGGVVGKHLLAPAPEECYAISEAEEAAMLTSSHAAIRQYLPTIRKDVLFADFAGIRPKLSRDGEPTRDFVIEALDVSRGGVPLDPSLIGTANSNLFALLGIESPGLTSSTAIADHVAALVGGADRANSAAMNAAIPWRRPKQ